MTTEYDQERFDTNNSKNVYQRARIQNQKQDISTNRSNFQLSITFKRWTIFCESQREVDYNKLTESIIEQKRKKKKVDRYEIIVLKTRIETLEWGRNKIQYYKILYSSHIETWRIYRIQNSIYRLKNIPTINENMHYKQWRIRRRQEKMVYYEKY